MIIKLFILCFIIYLIYTKIKLFFSSTYVKSSVDNKYYLVRNTKYKQKSADTLAMINIRIISLLDYLKKNGDQRFKLNINLLLSRYDPEAITENISMIDTSFTINKGSNVSFCVATRDTEERVYDINTIMFVALHELAHIGSFTHDHGDEFKNVFNYLLKEAVKLNIWEYTDYAKTPQEYCGIVIKNTPF